MSHSPIYSFALGLGWNLPIGSLMNVENIQDAAGKYLYPPQSFGSYRPGAPIAAVNGVVKRHGFPSLDWNWTGNGGKGWMTYGGANALRNGYFGSLWSNTLTISTPTTTALSYARYNVVATMSDYPESAPNFKVFNGFQIRMTHIVGPLS
jgi:hypothetical protein